MKNIKLRQFEESDKDIAYDLHIEGLKQSDSLVDDPKSLKELDHDLRNIKEVYIENNGEFFVALIDNKIVGMGALSKIDDVTAEIKRMRVKVEFQNKGIGGLILDKLIEKAKELGYKKLLLDTSTKQVAAQRLYESRDFKEYKRGELYGQKIIWYEKNIE